MSDKNTPYEFKIGDRVRYVGDRTPKLTGRAGTVINPKNVNDVRVMWDGDTERGVYASNLRLIETGPGEQSDPLYDALRELLDARRAEQRVTGERRRVALTVAEAQARFSKALAKAAKE